MIVELFPFAPFAILLIVGACFDIRSRIIPNWVCLLILIVAVATHVSTAGLSGLTTALAGLLLPLLVFIPFYALKVMGAGDVKFIAAAGSFIGLGGVANMIATVMILGGVLGLVQLLINRAPMFAPFLARYYYPQVGTKDFVPYGVAIAVGAILCPFFSVVALPI